MKTIKMLGEMGELIAAERLNADYLAGAIADAAAALSGHKLKKN